MKFQKGQPVQRRWYSTKEIANVFDVSPKTIRAWIRNGTLTASKIGPRLWRVDGLELFNRLDRQVAEVARAKALAER